MLSTLFGRQRNAQPNAALRLQIFLVIEKDGEGFHAYAPALKGLHVGGATEDEALFNAQNAVGIYLRSLAKHGDPLPVGPHLQVEEEPLRIAPVDQRSMTFEWPSMLMCGVS